MYEKNNPDVDAMFKTSGTDVNCGIYCDVKNCAYHSSDHYCTLDKVSIGANNSTNCSTSDETKCASFKARD